jgi:hypothetical protein
MNRVRGVLSERVECGSENGAPNLGRHIQSKGHDLEAEYGAFEFDAAQILEAG